MKFFKGNLYRVMFYDRNNDVYKTKEYKRYRYAYDYCMKIAKNYPDELYCLEILCLGSSNHKLVLIPPDKIYK